MKKLVELMRSGISPILRCAEALPESCHRTLIAENLAKLITGAQVIHLPLLTASPVERVDEQLALTLDTQSHGHTSGLISAATDANKSKRTQRSKRK
jgi:hypothetical protein